MTDMSLNLTAKDGVLYDLQKFVLSNSFIKQPSFALSASLALIGTLIGRKVMFNGNATNLYILNVAPSGAGKDAPQQCVKNIIIDLKLDSYLGSGDYVSDASLMDALPSNPVRLDIIDEASGLLTSVNKGANTFDGKMADILCELYTSSSSKFLGRALANGEIKGAVERPCVSLLMSTTPRGFSDSLTIKAVEKGLLGRTLIFQGNPHNPAERVAEFTTLNAKAQTQLREIASFEPPKKDGFKIGGITQEVQLLTADKEGGIYLDQIFKEFDNLRRDQGEDSLDLPIIARMFQQLCKLAAIHSISRGLDFIVNKDDVDFAYKLVKLNLKNFGVVLKENVHDSFEDAYIDKVRTYLDRNGKKSMRQILKGIRNNLSTSKRRATIEMMAKLGMITATYIKGDMLYENADN